MLMYRKRTERDGKKSKTEVEKLHLDECKKGQLSLTLDTY